MGCTNILGRGIPLNRANHVVLFSPPMSSDGQTTSLNYEDYVHRCGRTGRAGKPGIAITLHNSNQENFIIGEKKSFQFRWLTPQDGKKPGPFERQIVSWHRDHKSPSEVANRKTWKFDGKQK